MTEPLNEAPVPPDSFHKTAVVGRVILAFGLARGLWFIESDMGHKTSHLVSLDIVRTNGGNQLLHFTFFSLMFAIGWVK